MSYDLRIRKPGRKTEVIPTRKWPVVTQSQLRHASDLGKPAPDENPLVKHLTVGFVLTCNAINHLRKARKLADAKEDKELAKRCDEELRRLGEVRQQWPIELV